jgi:DNA-binding transcriptional LysR family regulator
VVSIESVDLNLLVVLHYVLAEGSVTRAAQRLHVTPSAVSNSLARLRDILGDPLLVRHGRALVATPRARDLAPQIAAVVDTARAVLTANEPFHPENAPGRSPSPPPTTSPSSPPSCSDLPTYCPGQRCASSRSTTPSRPTA